MLKKNKFTLYLTKKYLYNKYFSSKTDELL